jgi:hypothetical protein
MRDILTMHEADGTPEYLRKRKTFSPVRFYTFGEELRSQKEGI